MPFMFKRRSDEGTGADFIKYSIVAFCMICFVVLYVWQNIEIMKLKMAMRRSLVYKEELLKEQSRLKYEIECRRRYADVENWAFSYGMSWMRSGDFIVLEIKDADE